MKKIITSLLIGISIFALAGCSGKDDTQTTDTTIPTNLAKFETTDFSILYPQEWEVLNQEKFPTNVPPSTIVVIRNNIKSEIFTANLNVSQSPLKETTTSKDFATATINAAQNNLINFKEISREKVAVAGDETFIATFQGRKSATESLIEFKTLCLARNGFGIIITAAYLPNEDQIVVTKLSDMLKSFTLKNP